MRGPGNEGPSRNWARWRLDGWGAGRPRRKEGVWGEGPALAITTMFCSEFACVFRLSVSMRKVAGEHPFCVLIYVYCYIFHICFILFILLSYLIFDFVCLALSLADTHGIAKYARTYIRDKHTHAHTHTKKKVERLGKKTTKVERPKNKKKGRSGKKERRRRERTKIKGGERLRKIIKKSSSLLIVIKTIIIKIKIFGHFFERI